MRGRHHDEDGAVRARTVDRRRDGGAEVVTVDTAIRTTVTVSTPTILVHQICHNEIHTALTEAELARDFNTVETLRAHPRLAAFFDWVAKKPPEFHKRSAGGRRKR